MRPSLYRVHPGSRAPQSGSVVHRWLSAGQAQYPSCHRLLRMTKELRGEANEIAALRKPLVVNGLIAGGHRGSLDLKDGRTGPYLKGVSDAFGCAHRFQLVVRLDQRNSIFFLD